jgi:putative glycosyltransferase (TIGR04372 family)
VVLFVKIKRVVMVVPKLPLYVLAIPVVVVIRVIRPWYLVRFGGLVSSRIGHFAANTELYLCERDAGINVPKQRYLDIFYIAKPISNEQLAKMWRGVLMVWPAWILAPIVRLNRLLPGAAVHEIGSTHGRDLHNLYDRFPPHVKFTQEEEALGEAGMRDIGVPKGALYVCINVRDSAYLAGQGWAYHNYRDSDIQNYVLAAEELAARGLFVIRMGAKVHSSMKSNHPRVIDYATNGMRSDFMDIYLGAKCFFAISTGTGWDAIPEIFRRPIAYVNFGPFGYLCGYRNNVISITKHHFSLSKNRELSLSEIFTEGVGFCMQTSDYESKGVQLIDNTPEEIRDAAVEMVERLNGTWQPHEDDEALQKRFWEIFPTDAVDAYEGKPLHGEIRARFGASFLRNNRSWLQ